VFTRNFAVTLLLFVLCCFALEIFRLHDQANKLKRRLDLLASEWKKSAAQYLEQIDEPPNNLPHAAKVASRCLESCAKKLEEAQRGG
jgi:hypothetical protein